MLELSGFLERIENMNNFRFPKKKPKGDPKLILRERPSEKKDIPMKQYLELYGKLMGKNSDKTDDNSI